jgi:hypothetical protein
MPEQPCSVQVEEPPALPDLGSLLPGDPRRKVFIVPPPQLRECGVVAVIFGVFTCNNCGFTEDGALCEEHRQAFNEKRVGCGNCGTVGDYRYEELEL